MKRDQPLDGGTGAPQGVPAPLAGDTLAADRALVAAIANNDRKAAAELIAAHADAVYSYVRHRLSSRADRVDDLVQDVFLAGLSSIRSYRGMSSLRGWLLGIARHKVEDFYRHRLREPDPLLDETEDAGGPALEDPGMEERIDRGRAARRTRRILRHLPEAYAVVLLWRYWEHRSVKDIAAASGRTDKAVERLLARARLRFRELWDEVSHE